MRRASLTISVLLLAPVIAWTIKTSNVSDKFWPQWRGPDGSGVSHSANPPLEWSEEKNIKWKVKIPGKGSSTPIVWEDMVFVTTAVPTGEASQPDSDSGQRRGRRRRGIQPSHVQQFSIYAINRNDGKVLWHRVAREELPHEGTHPTGTWASPSSVTDGTHLFAYFGSRGLYCYDMKGNLVWEKDLGDMRIKLGFGEGSSPYLHGNTLVIIWDHEDQSFIVALDKSTGKEIWRVNRDEPSSWTTPLVVEHEGRAQVITSATNRVRSYDLETGRLIWECGGMTTNTIPSPVYKDGLVYVTSGFRGSALLAIRLADAKGDITGSDAVVWKYDRDTPYVPSPLLYQDEVYVLKVNSGILTCFDAKTGEVRYGPTRLEGIRDVYASPVAANDRVYLTGREGTTVVIKAGSKYEILATNTLEDGFDASMAIVDDEIYMRGASNLYCVSRQ